MNNTHYRSVLLGIILFFSGTVMAQVSKGDKQVQFLGSVYSQPEDTYRFVNAIFNLKASAYVSNNLELGVGGNSD